MPKQSPAGCTVPDGRVKPWGTGQAIACCRNVLHGLLEREQMVLVPTDRADYAAFLTDFRTYAPETLDFSKEEDYIPESCDHNGHHHG